ncbi:MAG TPA: ABC transporter substrate-binding protein [Candidatus Melainabacteria bacterium]|nr:ABC transporter substrate-binding protein [Candidatus Melainabacteria bacterium]
MSCQLKEIVVAHSPDSDDAFMFYGIAKGLLDTDGLKINQVHKDIQSLNQEALEGKYEVSAISFAAYPHIADTYKIMTCGASMGDNYGPVLVCREDFDEADLDKTVVAIPGKLTTAYLALNLYKPGLETKEEEFDQIIKMVADGRYDAGLLIHEGQLTYKDLGLKKLVDLGEWFMTETNLPLPLGGNAIRRDLGDEMINKLSDILKRSIQFSLDNRKDALAYAMTFAPDIPEDLADRFVGMYVNELTVDQGKRGEAAIRKLFEMANERGLYTKPVVPEFV